MHHKVPCVSQMLTKAFFHFVPQGQIYIYICDCPLLPARTCEPPHSHCDFSIGSSGIWVPVHSSGRCSRTHWSNSFYSTVFVLFWGHSNHLSLVKHGIGRKAAGIKSARTTQDGVSGQEAKSDTVLFTIWSFDALSSEGLVLLFSCSPLVVFGEPLAVYPHAFGSSHSLSALSQG